MMREVNTCKVNSLSTVRSSMCIITARQQGQREQAQSETQQCNLLLREISMWEQTMLQQFPITTPHSSWLLGSAFATSSFAVGARAVDGHSPVASS